MGHSFNIHSSTVLLPRNHPHLPQAPSLLPWYYRERCPHSCYYHGVCHKVYSPLLGYYCSNETSVWSHHVTNEEISARTGLPPVMDFIRRRRLSVYGHIARLTQGTPAHNALHCQVGLASGRSLGRDWRRRPGRPRTRWTDQLRNDTGSVPANLWRQAILRGHGGVTRWPQLAMR